MAEKDKDNKDGANPSGAINTVSDLNEFINSGGTSKAAKGASQVMTDLMESLKGKKGDIK